MIEAECDRHSEAVKKSSQQEFTISHRERCDRAMPGQIRFLCVAAIVPVVVVSSSSLALAQWFGGHPGRWGFFDTGIGAFGGGTYPGRAFGYDPRYLASRAFTAGGVAGSVTYGTPQPELTDVPPCPASLVRAATRPACSPEERVVIGESAFWYGDYLGAAAEWTSALEAGLRDPVLVMMLGQAYFAAGSYGEAAATTHAAMDALPEDQWGVVVRNRSELYGNPKSYILQLQQLEQAVNENPKDPAERFLLACHYAHLGYPQPAVAQLDEVVELEPRDELAVQLRKSLIPRLPAPGAPVITPGVVTATRRR